MGVVFVCISDRHGYGLFHPNSAAESSQSEVSVKQTGCKLITVLTVLKDYSFYLFWFWFSLYFLFPFVV